MDLGKVVLGQGGPVPEKDPAYRLLFRCRKNGFDYLGQLRVDSGATSAGVEVFNENYYAHFEKPSELVRRALEQAVLGAAARHNTLPEPFASIARSRLGAGTAVEKPETPPAEGPAIAGPVRLQDLYDRLNREYFDGKIDAGIQWARNTRGRNRRSFRFGSYDPRKKLIRINPRLQRPSVPLTVVELTVYHEMCHQLLPPFRHGGKRHTHHAEFRKKEREYKFYTEAKRWEKQHWRQLMAPHEDD
ncbi:MAG: SprT-like domain-containing protein [Nitrospinae bacterium]|nr:SprT-like domain-containing protein [Nitrospinota bacterium]